MEAADQLWYNTRTTRRGLGPGPRGRGLLARLPRPPASTGAPTHGPHRFCKKYQRNWRAWTPTLSRPRGQEIFASVSKKAWQDWQAHQTMLINEKHLSLVDPRRASTCNRKWTSSGRRGPRPGGRAMCRPQRVARHPPSRTRRP